MNIKDREIKIVIRAFEEIIEDSDVISDIKNDLFDVEERQKWDHDHAMETISEKVSCLESDINDKLDDLSERIDELFTEIEDLKSEKN
tara:strand:- start:2013 stop:2276 length:264 start_codon:yes stop_codon:yes gene_type:complete